MFEWKVTLSKGGRHIKVNVFAESTRRAYKQAEDLYPNTKALNATQVWITTFITWQTHNCPNHCVIS
jgi:hypothetical protein